MAGPTHGINGLVYISGAELSQANAWNLNIAQQSSESTAFGAAWVSRVVGPKDWSGSVSAWGELDSKLITDAATAGASVPILIYPDRNTLGSYYSGNAIFGMNSDGGTSGPHNRNGDFVGGGALTAVGFS